MPRSKPQAIRGLRIRNGYSMRQLAIGAGLNIATISGVEKNPKSVTPHTAKAICDLLSAPFDDLFTIDERLERRCE